MLSLLKAAEVSQGGLAPDALCSSILGRNYNGLLAGTLSKMRSASNSGLKIRSGRLGDWLSQAPGTQPVPTQELSSQVSSHQTLRGPYTV